MSEPMTPEELAGIREQFHAIGREYAAGYTSSADGMAREWGNDHGAALLAEVERQAKEIKRLESIMGHWAPEVQRQAEAARPVGVEAATSTEPTNTPAHLNPYDSMFAPLPMKLESAAPAVPKAPAREKPDA